ncbi:MAG: NADPH-dependent glutamate synthase [Deltaproteobacteria bacterium]|nr:MAG: NADPH-dependent glutamate synthase [Deltaproteobacteria bacterium]
MYRIVRTEKFSGQTFLWEVDAPDVARSAQPGHFVMLRLRDGAERIPLTVADFDREAGTITLVVQAVGKTTQEMMDAFGPGDTIEDFVGPLGQESHLERVGHVVLVGGGLGVAPIFPQLRALKELGNRTTSVVGFRSRELVFWEDRFARYSDELVVCTDDGSYGREGFVTVALEEVLRREPKPDLVIAIGPLPMMRACAEVSRPFGVPTVVSLNAIMVDGTGMCGSCRVTVGGSIRFACVDGPEFDAHQVDFEELMSRQRRFRGLEGQALGDYRKVCEVKLQLFENERRNYKKIKELQTHQTAMPERDARVRSRTFDEVNLGYTLQEALNEAERCIQCNKPTCIAGCPVSIDIPRFIRHLLVRDLAGALDVINESNLFPSVCGRVCPQESQCEAQCIIGKKVEPVAIGRLERFVGDHAPRPVPAVPELEAPIGRVAVVGSGPAGLACAADVAKAGAQVTVFEALHVVGGVLQYGIPSFRLPRETIAREIQKVRDLGVEILTNKVVGKTFSVAQLLGEMGYDAVFVGTGAGYPTFPGIPGEFAAQVYSANEFLTRVNLMGGDRFPYEDTPVHLGRRVCVIGAGNTAMDCLRVARRLGAEEVRCIYRRTESEAPARIEEIRHAKEEGITFHWLRTPVEIQVDAEANVRGLTTQVMELGEPDASGRRRPLAVEGRFETFEADTVIYALGTQANPIVAQSTPGLDTNKWGHIVADERWQSTSLPGVFAGGDIVTGGATVILAMGAGRRAATGILKWLESRRWPLSDAPVEAPAPLAGHVCPKCKKPLEDDAIEYVCCADALLTWSCEDCHKVYEGFAYPYGLCPTCGGKLHAGHDAEAEGEAAQQAVRQAMEIELGGMAFYGRGAARATDERVRRLFAGLREMEAGHLETLSRRYHVESAVSAEGDGITPAQVAVFAEVDAPEDDGIALVRLAVALEKRARAFFLKEGDRFAEGSAERLLYQELAAEEQEHVVMLRTELARLAGGKPGLL